MPDVTPDPISNEEALRLLREFPRQLGTQPEGGSHATSSLGEAEGLYAGKQSGHLA
jgi:topoisomerase IA-like protein